MQTGRRKDSTGNQHNGLHKDLRRQQLAQAGRARVSRGQARNDWPNHLLQYCTGALRKHQEIFLVVLWLYLLCSQAQRVGSQFCRVTLSMSISQLRSMFVLFDAANLP